MRNILPKGLNTNILTYFLMKTNAEQKIIKILGKEPLPVYKIAGLIGSSYTYTRTLLLKMEDTGKIKKIVMLNGVTYWETK